MYLSFSKTLARVGGFRIGCGLRLTKKNILWMPIVLMFVYMFQLMKYMCVVAVWVLYWFFYGMYYLTKQSIKAIVKLISKPKTNSLADNTPEKTD